MTTNNYSKNIGSVSSATMREEDLIPCFVDELRSMRPLHRNHRAMLRTIERRLQTGMTEDGSEEYYGSEEAGFDLNECLFDALNDYALPYFYFGSHPGDGADYGFWLSEEWEEQLNDANGIKVNDLAEVPTGFSGDVAVVNDHGNVSMYHYSRGRGRELWSIV